MNENYITKEQFENYKQIQNEIRGLETKKNSSLNQKKWEIFFTGLTGAFGCIDLITGSYIMGAAMLGASALFGMFAYLDYKDAADCSNKISELEKKVEWNERRLYNKRTNEKIWGLY